MPNSGLTSSRARNGLFVAAAGLTASLLPWWQRRIAFNDAEGHRTAVFGANVWNSSTVASVAVVLATLVGVATVATPRSPRRTSRARMWTVAAWAPLALTGWVVWSAWRLASEVASAVHYTVVLDHFDTPDYDVIRNRLEISSLSGSWEGPSWGFGVGLVLMIAVAFWATRAE